MASRISAGARLISILSGVIIDPQVIIDHEANDDVFATLEVEWGYMMVPESGISAYFRPGIGLGSDKLYDWNFEIGLKFVWR